MDERTRTVKSEVINMATKWMQKLKIKKGALRKTMGAKKGKPIPMSKINTKISSLRKRAAGAKKLNPNERLMLRRLVLAKTFKKVSRKKKK
jgi:hypothetical protein